MFRFSRNKKIILVIGLFLSFIFVPTSTHAACSPFDATCLVSAGAAGIGSGIAEMVLASLTLVQSLLLAGIVKMGSILTWVIGLRPDGGGAVVYGAWNILKEFCNMAFIVVLILTSFGTIFNTFQFEFLKPYSIYKKELIGAFLIAAIFMNFSLAIGQSIVALSNKVTDVMIGIIVPLGGQGIGDQIAAELNVAQAVGRGQVPLANLPTTTSTGAAIATPAPDQSSTTPTATQQQTQNRLWEIAFETNYLKCLNDSVWPAWVNNKSCYTGTVQKMGKLPYPSAATAMQTQWSTGAGDPPSVTKIGGLLTMATGVGGQYTTTTNYQASAASIAQTPVTGVGATLAKIPSLFYSIFLLLVLGLSFLCVIVFMVIRIPAVWIILVLSPLAWVGLMFPSSGASKKWWSQFMAWNLFSPMYLFMIYFGLYMLAQQPNLLAQLTSSGNPIDAQIGALLFYIMTGIIFVGGSSAVVSIAFKGGTVAGAVFSKISGGLGIKGDFGAVGAVYRGTGMQAQIQGATERVQQQGRDFGAGLRGRFPGIVGTREEALATARQRYGVRGGTAEVEKLQKKRIDEQQAILKGKKPDETALKKLLASGNRDTSLAAGEILLSKGQLDTAGRQKMLEGYGKISPVAKEAFQKRVTEQAQKESRKNWDQYLTKKTQPDGTEVEEFDIEKFKDAAKLVGNSGEKRKFLEAAIQGEVGNRAKLGGKELMDLADLMKENVEDQRAFLETTTKGGRNKVAAIETMANLNLLHDRNGKTVRVDEALEERAATLTDNDLLDAEEHYANDPSGKQMPTALRERMRTSMRQPGKFGQILKNVSGPEQQLRVLEQYADVKKASAEAQQRIPIIQNRDSQYARVVKRLQERKKTEKDPTKREKVIKVLKDVEIHRASLGDRIAELKKNVSWKPNQQQPKKKKQK